MRFSAAGYDYPLGIDLRDTVCTKSVDGEIARDEGQAEGLPFCLAVVVDSPTTSAKPGL